MAVTTRDKRLLTVALCVVLLAVGVYFILGRSGGGSPEAISPPASVSVPSNQPAPSPSVESVDDSADDLVFTGRDPFQPLIDPEASAEGTPSTDVSPAAPPPPAPAGGSSITIDGHTVVLLDLFTQDGQEMVQVEVDGTVHTAQQGEIFAGNFQLQSVDGSCADFLYGDQSFTLCESTGK